MEAFNERSCIAAAHNAHRRLSSNADGKSKKKPIEQFRDIIGHSVYFQRATSVQYEFRIEKNGG